MLTDPDELDELVPDEACEREEGIRCNEGEDNDVPEVVATGDDGGECSTFCWGLETMKFASCSEEQHPVAASMTLCSQGRK